MNFIGRDDGYQGAANEHLALATTKVDEAQRRGRTRLDTGRWPSAGTVVRVVVLSLAAIVVIGWLLTLLSS